MHTKSEIQKMLQEGEAYIIKVCSLTGTEYSNSHQCHASDICNCEESNFVEEVHKTGTGTYLGRLDDFKD